MTLEIVYETHAPTPDNTRGVISGRRDTPPAEDGLRALIAHSANKWSLDCLLGGARIEELVRGPFVCNPGREYRA
ncbi:hypothetical protein ACWEBX_15280 [Streptomyces sp. NPDC005070]